MTVDELINPGFLSAAHIDIIILNCSKVVNYIYVRNMKDKWSRN